MISQNKRKLLRLLEQKKRRDAEGLFIAEGRKTVSDLLRGGMSCLFLAATPQRLPDLQSLAPAAEIVEASDDELTEVSALQTRSEVIAIFRQRKTPLPTPDNHTLILALDDVQDPGNLGTIIRTADWFGVHHIVCSRACADIYNPKTVQATMGALCRARVAYTDLAQWLPTTALPIFGAYLDGDCVYSAALPQAAILLMGNEGHGISPRLAPLITNRLHIPNYPTDAPTSESLNVSTATAILLSEFRRRLL